MVRAAIVGLGRWGRSLVTAVQGKTDEISFVLGHTRTRSSAEAFCRDKGGTLTHSYEASLADPAIDAVVLATPHSQHEAQVMAAAAAGKHVFCEKPFTLTADDAARAIAAAQKAGIVLAVGFNRRFAPAMAELRSRIKDGRMGVIEPGSVEQTAGTGPSIQPGAWRADPNETPAAAMTGIGIHIVDGMIDLFGEVAEVHCVTARRASPHVDDCTTVMLKFKAGMSGTFFCSLATVPNYRFAVYGSKALAEIHKPTLEDFRFVAAPEIYSGHLTVVEPELKSTPGFDTLNAELVAFARAVRDKVPYPVPHDQVLHGVKVFEAIVESSRIGKPLAVG